MTGITYTISPMAGCAFEEFEVEAASYGEAANKAVKKIYPYTRGLRALRTTGDAGLSGVFQGYVPARYERGALTTKGGNFHASKR